MKRWLTVSLLVVLAGVLLVIVINSNSNRDPIAALEMRGFQIERNGQNGQGAVWGVSFGGDLPPDADWVQHFLWGLGFRSPNDADLVNLRGLPTLRHLSLRPGGNGGKITDAGLVHLKGLANLQMIVLDGTKVTDAGLVHLKGLRLTGLSLPDGARTDLGLKHYLAALETHTRTQLILFDWRITDTGLVHLKGLTELAGSQPQQPPDHRCGTGASQGADQTGAS